MRFFFRKERSDKAAAGASRSEKRIGTEKKNTELAKSVTSEKEKEPEKAPEEKKSVLLSEKTRKFQNLRKVLLSEVRGQRHAVDEVVQGIFESEMFAADNPKRKGPLATQYH